jgi:multicomponent Na+:H+ antiporter subunit A
MPAMLLIVLGCFTKSAQFPFHFWLPNAMAAPTPVSAYLHSASMVKLGVYLLARVDPLFGDRDDWMALLVVAGTATMLAAALLALRERDLKRILAYSTVVALRTLGEIAVLAAAAALGISRVTLWSKMKRLGLGR